MLGRSLLSEQDWPTFLVGSQVAPVTFIRLYRGPLQSGHRVLQTTGNFMNWFLLFFDTFKVREGNPHADQITYSAR